MSATFRAIVAAIILIPAYFGAPHANERSSSESKQHSGRNAEAEQVAYPPYQPWGLALSGGGTRSASFSMGVLGQLQATGALDKFGAISSVSGGGFAAYYYYMHQVRHSEKKAGWRTETTKNEPFVDYLWRPFLHEVATNAGGACKCSYDKDKDKDKDNIVIGACLRDISASANACRQPPPELSETQKIILSCLPQNPPLGDRDVFTSRDNFAQPACAKKRRDEARHQLHISSWRDVLAGDGAKLESLAKANDETTVTGLLFSSLGFQTAVSTIPHFLANTVFDWRLNFSPTQQRYQGGIHRTYGVSPARRESEAGNDPTEKKCRPFDQPKDQPNSKYEEKLDGLSEINRELDILCMYEDPNVSVRQICAGKTGELIGKENATCRRDELRKRITLEAAAAHWKPLEFNELAQATAKNSLPLWIINTSVGKGGMALDFSVGKTGAFHETNFEITPFDVGSRSRDLIPQDTSGSSQEESKSHYGLTVLDAVATSAAFFDPQQQDGSAIGKVAKGAGMHLLNTKWGRDIPNHKVGSARRALHHILPFPLYYLNGYLPGMETPYLHLSDGGHASDNLGIYALILRGYKKIVAVDGTFDADGKLDDLCYLRWNLAKYHGAEIEFSDAARVLNAAEDKSQLSLEKICGAFESSGYDPDNAILKRAAIHRWSNPVERLQVRPNEKYAEMIPDCPAEVSTANIPQTKCPSPLKDDVDIYYIKLAMNLPDWFADNELLTHYKSRKDLPTLKKQFQTCTPSVMDIGRIKEFSSPPCTLSVFVKLNLPGDPKNVTSSGWAWIDDKNSDGKATGQRCLRPVFPQHQTVNSTLDGSRRSYYAYRDLGAHAARKMLAHDLFSPSGPSTPIESKSAGDRYMNGSCDPLLYPMESSLLVN
jgi:hypothetical protein